MRPLVRINYLDIHFICVMSSSSGKILCNFISKEWISKAKSNRSFATNHNIDEKTVRKILNKDGYDMPISTLEKICEAREIKLMDLFKLIDI